MRKLHYGPLAVASLVCLLLAMASCRKGELEDVLRSEAVKVTEPVVPGAVAGFFLLNEGNMGSNRASIDYFDYATGVYHRNIYPERNPGVVQELGDVGNDIQIYRDRLYAVINCSNLIEVMDVETAGHIGSVSVANCRYITFKDEYAYVSSYAGPVGVDPNYRMGCVIRINIATLKVEGECTVGYQPEEMVIVGDKLYVANSGGYSPGNYDRTVSVVDLGRFEEVKKIDVAVNLHRMEKDNYGNIYVSSRGEYQTVPSKTFIIDTADDSVAETPEGLPNSNMALYGDWLYVCGAGEGGASYAVLNTADKSIVTRSLIKDGTGKSIKVPYGIAVNPDNGEFFITDATNYTTPGYVYCFNPDGTLKWKVWAGDVPAHIAFTAKPLLPLD